MHACITHHEAVLAGLHHHDGHQSIIQSYHVPGHEPRMGLGEEGGAVVREACRMTTCLAMSRAWAYAGRGGQL